MFAPVQIRMKLKLSGKVCKTIKIFYAFIRISTSSLQNHECKLITNILRSNLGKFIVINNFIAYQRINFRRKQTIIMSYIAT